MLLIMSKLNSQEFGAFSPEEANLADGGDGRFYGIGTCRSPVRAGGKRLAFISKAESLVIHKRLPRR